MKYVNRIAPMIVPMIGAIAHAQDDVPPKATASDPMESIRTMTMVQWGLLGAMVILIGWLIGWFVFKGCLDRMGPRKAGRTGVLVGLICGLLLQFVPIFILGKPLAAVLIASPTGKSDGTGKPAETSSPSSGGAKPTPSDATATGGTGDY